MTRKAGPLSLLLTIVSTVLSTIPSTRMDPINVPWMSGESSQSPFAFPVLFSFRLHGWKVPDLLQTRPSDSLFLVFVILWYPGEDSGS